MKSRGDERTPNGIEHHASAPFERKQRRVTYQAATASALRVQQGRERRARVLGERHCAD